MPSQKVCGSIGYIGFEYFLLFTRSHAVFFLWAKSTKNQSLWVSAASNSHTGRPLGAAQEEPPRDVATTVSAAAPGPAAASSSSAACQPDSQRESGQASSGSRRRLIQAGMFPATSDNVAAYKRQNVDAETRWRLDTSNAKTKRRRERR